MLVIGTGYFGRMKVPPEMPAALSHAGIQVSLLKTGDAVSEFNRLQQKYTRIVAVLHLTC